MEFALSSDQQMLQETVRRFVEEQAPLDTIRRIAEGDDSAARALQAGIDELGLAGILVPESEGGAGLGLLDAVLVQECFGYGVAPSGFMGNVVAAWVLRDLAPELASAIARGEARYGLAIGGFMSRRDGAAITASGGKLSGTALMIPEASGLTYLLTCADDGGVHVCKAPDTTAMKTIDRSRRFAEAALDSGISLASDPDSSEAMAVAGLMVAADTLGAAQAMLDKAVAYAKEREQFGRVIGSFQAVKHLCAEMAAKLEPSRALVWHAAHALDMGEDEGLAMALLAKAHLSDVGTFVAKTATEVHGGMGFTDLLGLHYWFKRIGVNRQLFMSPQQARELAARVQGLVNA